MTGFRLSTLIRGSSLFLAALLAAGCAARRPAARAWHLVPATRGHLLVPPSPNSQAGPFTLRHARDNRRGGAGCGLGATGLSLLWKGRDAVVRADAAALSPVPGSLARAWTPDGREMALTEQTVIEHNWFEEDLRPGLEKLAARGCLTATNAASLDRRMIDHLAMPSPMAYRLRYGNYVMTGYMDLEPQFRLKSVEPIRDGEQVTGYLSAFYPLEPAPGGGVRVLRGESESNLATKITRGQAPDSELLHLPESAVHLRLYFRSWSISQDRRIALLAAPSRSTLESASGEFEADPEGFCATAATKSVTCIAVPKNMVLYAELRVRANGAQHYVPVGGGIGDLLRTAGVKNQVETLKTLKVSRPYEGASRPLEFDRSNNEILRLVLIGGEEVTW